MLTRYLLTGLFLAALAAFFVSPTVGGIVASLLFGFMAGNFACSLVHRLPRGRGVLEEKPYCGACQHPLSEADLLPVFGATLLGHKCRYCRAPIPYTHTITELVTGALFAYLFWRFGFSQEYLLLAGVGVFFAVLVSIEHNEGVVMERVLLPIAAFAALYRALTDGNVFDFFLGALIAGMLGAALWRKDIKPVRHVYTFPDAVKLLALGGLCVGLQQVHWFLGAWALLFGLCYMFRKQLSPQGRTPLSLPVALAVMGVLLGGEYLPR